ncbi:hypothetical protein B0H17DRAFT_1178591 [Mycena rosella]|uniref:Uncharacterized protein n=1 Tax=Mycena rosella TaxID=1033263 RepID=A0AAD7DLK1_MYCRO|nr:hypothetical protein B0H17DRAFT_1178591 [Mycena rosella]
MSGAIREGVETDVFWHINSGLASVIASGLNDSTRASVHTMVAKFSEFELEDRLRLVSGPGGEDVVPLDVCGASSPSAMRGLKIEAHYSRFSKENFGDVDITNTASGKTIIAFDRDLGRIDCDKARRSACLQDLDGACAFPRGIDTPGCTIPHYHTAFNSTRYFPWLKSGYYFSARRRTAEKRPRLMHCPGRSGDLGDSPFHLTKLVIRINQGLTVSRLWQPETTGHPDGSESPQRHGQRALPTGESLRRMRVNRCTMMCPAVELHSEAVGGPHVMSIRAQAAASVPRGGETGGAALGSGRRFAR